MRRIVGVAALLGATALGLLGPSPGWAGTAAVEDYALSYAAQPGEINRLKVLFEENADGGPRYVLEDAAGITVGSGCAAVTADRVTCAGDIQFVSVDVKDQDDVVELPVSYRPIGAGPQPPTCPPGLVCDVFYSTGGAVSAGEGDDIVLGGSPGDGGLERLDGGPGDDWLAARTTPGNSAGLDGGPGGDALDCTRSRGGCSMFGGEGGDLLLGSASSRDEFDAGPGDDTLRSRDGRAEDLFCGDGLDRFQADPDDRPRACETQLTDPPADQPNPCGSGLARQTTRIRSNMLRPHAVGRRRGRLVISRIWGRMIPVCGRPCPGRVRIGVRARGKRLAVHVTRLNADCRWSKRIVFPTRWLPHYQRRRLNRGRPVTLLVAARFAGNAHQVGDTSPSTRYRVRP